MTSRRLRITFARGEQLRFISHLDLMRFWERAFRRAAITIALSEGFTPRPRIALAAPLPVGTTGAAELMDVYLSEPLPPADLLKQLAPQLPAGISVSAATVVDLREPSLQSQLRAAAYQLILSDAVGVAAAVEAVAAFLALEHLPWEQQREGETRRYDLRPLVESLCVEPAGPPVALYMRLDARPGATGRPDQVVAALRLPAAERIHRLALILESSDAGSEGVGPCA